MLRKPVVRVVLDLPRPFADGVPIWSGEPIGCRGVKLAADCNADRLLMTLRPRLTTSRWLQTLPNLLREFGWQEPILGRFIVDGWAIVSEQDPVQHLNGHGQAVVERATGPTALRLPTDEVAGGAFVQWFRLGERQDFRSLVAVPDLARMTPMPLSLS